MQLSKMMCITKGKETWAMVCIMLKYSQLITGKYYTTRFTYFSDLVMTAQHQDRSNESFVIEIRGSDKVEGLVNREFRGDFEAMSGHLKIMNKRMVLLNPVSYKLFYDFDINCLIFLIAICQEKSNE